MKAIASFHLIRQASAVRAMARLESDRRLLNATPGLQFWRLLGTGRGTSTGPGGDLRRTALFAVWDDEAALNRFHDRMASRWVKDVETWHVRLRSAGGHGVWRATPVLDLIQPALANGGPVAILTRAHVPRRKWRAFRAAGRPVSDELQHADGLLAVAGIGEAPVAMLGTFSLWRDLDAVSAYAAEMPHHREVVRRARAEQWYDEELFARFEPYDSTGTWDGRDPLRDARPETGSSMP